MTTSPASAIQARALAALAAHRAQTPVPAWPEAPQLRALLLDAAGTLLSPSEPAALVIQRHARPYGCKLTELEILKNFRWCAPPAPSPGFRHPYHLTSYEGAHASFFRHASISKRAARLYVWLWSI